MLLKNINKTFLTSQELKNKFLRIEETRGNVSLRDNEMKQLINGTPLIPALEKLVIWAKDSQNYYLSLYPLIFHQAKFQKLCILKNLPIYRLLIM